MRLATGPAVGRAAVGQADFGVDTVSDQATNDPLRLILRWLRHSNSIPVARTAGNEAIGAPFGEAWKTGLPEMSVSIGIHSQCVRARRCRCGRTPSSGRPWRCPALLGPVIGFPFNPAAGEEGRQRQVAAGSVKARMIASMRTNLEWTSDISHTISGADCALWAQ